MLDIFFYNFWVMTLIVSPAANPSLLYLSQFSVASSFDDSRGRTLSWLVSIDAI